MPSKTYLLTLTPLDHFFFGGEHFKDDDDRFFYFQRSEDFPQQTTLLGMIRYQLLLQNGLLEPNPKGGEKITDLGQAKQLIGEQGIRIAGDELQLDLGVIQRLSPIFICSEYGKQQYFPACKIGQTDAGPALEPTITPLSNAQASFGPEAAAKPFFAVKGYKAKSELEQGFCSISGDFKPYEDIFNINEGEQIGVYKSSWRTPGEKNLEGFYKFQYKRLQVKPRYAFGCYLTMAAGTLPVLGESFVWLGKERSPFSLQVKAQDQAPFSGQITPGACIWLLSDAFLQPDVYACCDAVLGDTISFRYINTPLSATDHFADPKDRRSQIRCNLLKKGALLWVKNDQDAAISLQNMLQPPIETWGQLGFNQFTIKN